MAQDMIKRQLLLKASRDKVWDAITTPAQLAKWFSTTIDATTLMPGQEFRFGWSKYDAYSRAIVVELTPKTRFAYRWEDSDGDQSAPLAETPTTLVTFELEDAEEGTRLTVVESGIAAMPNRANVFTENSDGWDYELHELQMYLEAA